jgi:hypothetical protein
VNVEEVYREAEGATEYFLWLKAMRDTWIAHRHGPSRQAAVGVFLNENTGALIGFGHIQSNFQCPPAEAVSDLRMFIHAAISYTEKEMNAIGKIVEEQAKSMYPTSLRKLPKAGITAPGTSTLRMGRKKFRGITPISQMRDAPK